MWFGNILWVILLNLFFFLLFLFIFLYDNLILFKLSHQSLFIWQIRTTKLLLNFIKQKLWILCYRNLRLCIILIYRLTQYLIKWWTKNFITYLFIISIFIYIQSKPIIDFLFLLLFWIIYSLYFSTLDSWRF